jgi:hypothetical protein
MPDALRIKLSKEDINEIQGAIPFDPLFPMNFLFNFKGTQDYNELQPRRVLWRR